MQTRAGAGEIVDYLIYGIWFGQLPYLIVCAEYRPVGVNHLCSPDRLWDLRRRSAARSLPACQYFPLLV